MEEKLVLNGVFSEFNRTPVYIEKKLGKKIKGRKAIPDYYMLNKRVLHQLPEIYTENDYNLVYIAQLKRALHDCKRFECDNISDSSEILLISVDNNFDGYTLDGLFDLKEKNGI